MTPTPILAASIRTSVGVFVRPGAYRHLAGDYPTPVTTIRHYTTWS